MKQRIIVKRVAKCLSSWNDIDIPEGWTVKQLSTTSIVKSSTSAPDVVVITALIEKEE